ncbi:MAG: arsenate reductase ArsC [Methanomicrobiales archaeon]|nr:arsenate reductase ArsC [Methanomicrobiales archaeon]
MQAPEPAKKSILFLSSYNSVRSQIAEGFMRQIFGDRYDISSAGVASGGVSPHAIRVMREIGIDIHHQRSKSINELKGRTFDIVVTLCDHGKEACIHCLPKGERVLHHNFLPPNEVGLPEEEIMEEFRELRGQINTWLVQQFS